MDTGVWVISILSAILLVWYVVAHAWNRRIGVSTSEWLRKGLSAFGSLKEVRRMGSLASAGQLVVQQAVEPFRSLEVVFLLEPRENLPFWIFTHLDGRRDTIVVRANMKTAPVQEFEVARSGERGIKKIPADLQKKPYELIAGPKEFELARRGRRDKAAVDRLLAFLDCYREAIGRISVQSKEPHLTIQASLPALRKSQPEDFFEAVRQLAQ